MRSSILLLAMFIASPVFAQTASPNEQALGAKLMREIGESVTCSASVITLQAEIQRLAARVKELEPKVVTPKND